MTRYDAYAIEKQLAKFAASQRDLGMAEYHWSRAHVLAQPNLAAHLQSHVGLLRLYLMQGRHIDAWGQVWRMILAVPGTWLGRLPLGNSGLSSVSAFAQMAPPEDLRAIVQQPWETR